MHIFFGILTLILIFASLQGASKSRKELLKWAIPAAVEIAYAREWVSPHRLRNQLHLTKSDAQMVLREACAQGYLYQAVNGRYYPDTRNIPGIKTIDANSVEDNDETEVVGQKSFLPMFFVWVVGISFLAGFLIMKDRSSQKAEAVVDNSNLETKTDAVTTIQRPQTRVEDPPAPNNVSKKQHRAVKKQPVE